MNFLFHLFICSLDFYTLWYDQKYITLDGLGGMEYPFKNRIIFLTIWTLVIQTIYMGVAFLNDVFGTNKPDPLHPPTIRTIKDALFSIAYISAVFVTIYFWGLSFIDKDLVMPERVLKTYPPWVNHVMHTFVSIFINIEMFTANIKYPSKKVNYTMIIFLLFSYITTIITVFIQTGHWPYVIFDSMNWTGRFFFMIGIFIITFGINSLAITLNRKLSKSKTKLT